MKDTTRRNGKYRVLFVGEGTTAAHVLRPLALAKALDPLLYDVVFACDERFVKLLQGSGLRHMPLASIPSEAFVERLAAGQPIYTEEELRTYVDDEIQLLEDVAPDVVVGDFRVTLGVSATLLGVPYVNIVNAHWSPYFDGDCPLPEHAMVRLLGVKAAGLVFRAMAPIVLGWHIRNFNRVRRSYGLKPVESLQHMYSDGTWTLYTDLPELCPVRNAPPSHRYVGPFMVEPNVPLPEWHERLPRNKPIVYISPGSSGNTRATLDIINTAAEMPVTVMAVTAKRLNPADLPKSVYVADYLPGSWAVQQAQVVVCSGGSAPSHQALAAGRPILGIPYNMDQYYSMETIVRAGAGLLVRSGKVSPRAIRRSLQRLLDEPGFARSAKRLQACMAKWSFRHEFTRFLDRVVSDFSASTQSDRRTQRVA